MNMGFYSCDSVSTSAFQAFMTTFSGQSDAGTWLALRSSDFDKLLSSTAKSASRTASLTSANNLPVASTSGASASSAGSQLPFTTTPSANFASRGYLDSQKTTSKRSVANIP